VVDKVARKICKDLDIPSCPFGLRPGADMESDWRVKNEEPHYGLK